MLIMWERWLPKSYKKTLVLGALLVRNGVGTTGEKNNIHQSRDIFHSLNYNLTVSSSMGIRKNKR